MVEVGCSDVSPVLLPCFLLLNLLAHQILSRTHTPALPLDPLPYAYDALEPRLSRQTMTLHHTKHHAKHIAIINGMIEGTDMHKDSLEVSVSNSVCKRTHISSRSHTARMKSY